MFFLTKYDLKQIILIEQKIIALEKNKADLHETICDLVGLLNTLETVDESWKDDFRAEVNALKNNQ